jgi:hypothetical protein
VCELSRIFLVIMFFFRATIDFPYRGTTMSALQEKQKRSPARGKADGN